MLPTLLGSVLVVGAPAVSQEVPSAEVLFEAWQSLDESGRSDVVEWYTAECDNARHFRAELERFVLAQHRDRGDDWPEARSTFPIYDSETHTPRDVIPRRAVKEGSSKYKRVAKTLLGDRKERGFRPAFEYDWTRGTVVTLGDWEDPERVAFNAARGMSPYADLVEALVEMQLDGGEVREEAAAFGHAYSDRAGNAYPTISLYDAWSSGSKLEMPDVECLGIIHDLENDWRSFRAPVPDSKHDRLYARIGEHYAKLRKYRALRTAIARCYLAAEPTLPAGYGPSVLRMHGFWELQTSDPNKMADDLPSVKGWGRWFEKRAAQADDDLEVVERSRSRMKTLDESRDWSRRTFHGILKEYGAFDPKPAKGDGTGDGGR